MALIVIPIILPMSLCYYLGIGQIIMYVRAVALIILFLMLFQKQFILDKYILHIAIYAIFLFVATVWKGGSVSKCFTNLLNVLCPVLWCKVSFQRGRAYQCIKILSVFLIIMAIADIIVYLLLPEGLMVYQTGELLARTGLISNSNSITPYLIPSCFIVLFALAKEEKDSLINSLWLMFCFMFAIFFVFTGNGMFVSIICIVLFFAYSYTEKVSTVLNAKAMMIVLAVLFVLVCVFQQTNWLGELSALFTSSSTFSGRTQLWIYVIPQILHSPFIGYGVQENTYLSGYLYRTTAHNMYFQLLLWSGLIGCIPLVLIMNNTLKKVMQYWETSKAIRILSIGIIGTLIYFMLEVHVFVPIFWLALSYLNYYDKFLETDEQLNNNEIM